MKKLMPDCLCGHEWEDHHGGMVQNPDYYDDPLSPQSRHAQECEATQTNGVWHYKDTRKRCYCESYCPNNWKLYKAGWYFRYKLGKKERMNYAIQNS